MIAEQEVTHQVLDLRMLAPTVTATMETLDVQTIEAVAEQGYFKFEDIKACEAAGITAYVPEPIRGFSVRESFFTKEKFCYQADRDVFLCPGNAVLLPRHFGRSRNNGKIDYITCKACRSCVLKSCCTTNAFRRVSRLENEAVLDRMSARLAARPDMLRQRRETVEHHQAMDKPGRIPDATAGQRSRRVQPDRAGLQYSQSDQSYWYMRPDFSNEDIK